MEKVRKKSIEKNKCKNCGGQMFFDPKSQSLKCIQCGTLNVFEIEQNGFEKHNYDELSTLSDEKLNFDEYVCLTCGTHHVFNEEMPVLSQNFSCSSCGDKNFHKISNINYKPDGVVPFKISKQLALKNFFSWINNRKMLPKDLKNLDRTVSLEMAYLPVYVYDFDASCRYFGVGVNTITNANGQITRHEEHFSGKFNKKFVNHFQSASSNLGEVPLLKVLPFDVKTCHSFQPELFYGIESKAIDINLQDNFRTMLQKVKRQFANEAKNQLNFDEIYSFSCDTNFSNIKFAQLYIPIYKGKYTYRKKTYNFFVNGESGKVVGQAPKSILKTLGIALLVALGVAGVALLLSLIIK